MTKARKEEAGVRSQQPPETLAEAVAELRVMGLDPTEVGLCLERVALAALAEIERPPETLEEAAAELRDVGLDPADVGTQIEHVALAEMEKGLEWMSDRPEALSEDLARIENCPPYKNQSPGHAGEDKSRGLFQTCDDYQASPLLIARAAGVHPFFLRLEGSEGPVVTYQGKEVVMLGSNNYLGLTHHPRVREAAKQAIDQYGTGCTGSRFLNGNLDLHDELEHELATFFGYDEALVFASGFLANVGVIAALGSIPGTVIFSERENHASLIDGTRLARGEVRLFKDLGDLEAQLAIGTDWSHALVVCDAVFSMTGRVTDLRRLAELKRRFKFKLYVDDAHSIGVLGPDGRGAVFEQGVRLDVDLLFGTLSKSLASLGGFVCGERSVIDWLRHTTRTLIFTAGLPPASVAAALAALCVVKDEAGELRSRVWANARYWREGLDAIGYYTMGSITPIVPAMIGSESLALRVARDLLDLGVFAIPVRFPVVPVGQSLIRTSVMPTHTRAHLDQALDAFAQVRKRYDIPAFDPENLPIVESEDWSWVLPDQAKSASSAA